MSEISTKRVWLKVYYHKKWQAKLLGAMWDPKRKSWFAPKGTDLEPLRRAGFLHGHPIQHRPASPTNEGATALQPH